MDEIQTGDRFGDGMLDLEARVHLEEVELRVVSVACEQKLARARVHVADGSGGGERRLRDSLAEPGRDRWARGFLDDFLVPALQGAVALEQVRDRAVRVGHDLHLDVPRPIDQPFDVECSGRKGPLRLTSGRRDGLGSVRLA